MSGECKNVFEVQWRIENLKSWLNTRDDCLNSPQFLAENLSNTRWKLRLSRKWQLAEKYIGLALERDVEDNHTVPIVLNYEFSFLSYDGSTLKSKSFTMKFAPKTISQELKLNGLEILGEKKEAYLPEGALTVSCKLWKAWSTISKGGQCSLRSVIGRKCITLEGTIDNFSKLYTDSNVTVNFMSPSSEISFVAFDVRRLKSDYVTFERTEVECKCFSSYSCKLFALTTDGLRKECANSSDLITLLTPFKSCLFNSTYYYYTFNCCPYLKNDTLTLQIDITYNPGVESENIDYKKLSAGTTNMCTSNSEDVHSSLFDPLHIYELEDESCAFENNGTGDESECFDAAEKTNLPLTTLKEDLISLYEDRFFCDTNLRTDTETFPAHRNVLSARSPVFKEMFTNRMKDKAGECINVPDTSSETVRQMLQFLYTDCTGDLDMLSAKELYIASDKYDITSLRERCSSYMKKNLCPSNVCEVIALADKHQDKDLESAAHEFVLTYDKEVFGSNEWQSFMKNFSNLAAQVMYLKCMKE